MMLVVNMIDIYRIMVIYVYTLVGVLFSRELFSETGIPHKEKTKQKNQKENID